MQIEVIQVKKEHKQAKTAYVLLEVTYKQLGGAYAGKVASKKLISFSQPDGAYKALADAKPGEVYTITSKKNMESGFIDWLDAKQEAPNTGEQSYTPNQETSKTMTVAKSTYETPAERAKKQIYIIKQSSLSTALELAKLNNPKGGLSVLELTNVAQSLVDWVVASPAAPATETLSDIPD